MTTATLLDPERRCPGSKRLVVEVPPGTRRHTSARCPECGVDLIVALRLTEGGVSLRIPEHSPPE